MMLSLAAVAAGAALVAGCGGGNSNTGGASAPTGPVVGTKVTATEKEYSITLSTTTFAPGEYTFVTQNQGTMPHNLNIAGPGVTGKVTQTVSPGNSGQVTVNLQKGTYELWCSVDGHKDLGMDIHIQVA